MGNKATKFETSQNHDNHHHHYEQQEGAAPPSTSSTRRSRTSSFFRTSINRPSGGGGLTSSRSQPALIRSREENSSSDDEDDNDIGEQLQNETLKRKQPSSTPTSTTSNVRRKSVNSRSILLLLTGTGGREDVLEEQNYIGTPTNNNYNNNNKIMDRSTELNDSFLRQMKRRTLNLGSALFSRKASPSGSPATSTLSPNKIQSPPTSAMKNSSSVSVLVPMILSDDDDSDEGEPKTPLSGAGNRLSIIIENVPTVSSPNSSPTTNGQSTTSANFVSFNNSSDVVEQPHGGKLSPNGKMGNSPGNRKSQLLLNLVMMNRNKSSKQNLEGMDVSDSVNTKPQRLENKQGIVLENEVAVITPSSPSGSSSNSSTSITSIKMTFSQSHKTLSPTPLHSTTSSSNLSRQVSHSSSRRRSIGAFVFEPFRFNNRSISPNTILPTPTTNINSLHDTTNVTTTIPTLSPNQINGTTTTNSISNTSANNLLSVGNNFGGSNSTLTPTTSQHSISPRSPRSPRSPIDRTLGESRVELRKKVFSVRLENKEGSNSSLVSLAFPGKGIDDTVVNHQDGTQDAEIEHANLIDFKFHFLFSMSTTERLIDKQLDLEDMEDSALSGNIETDSHRLNQSMVFLSSASNFHDRNSRKALYIKGLQSIFEKLYKTQMNLDENHVEDNEIHQQDRDTFKMTLMLGIPHLADKMIKSELDQVLQFNGEYENYVEKKRREKRDLTIALQKLQANTTEYDFTKGKIDNFLILKREEFFLTDELSSNTNLKNTNPSSNLLIDTSNIFRNDRIDSTSNFISERERILIEQDQIKFKYPIKLFILFTTNNNQITNATNGTFVNSKFFIKVLSKIGKITGLLPQFGFLHMSLIMSSMRFDWLDSELCVPKTKLKSMRAIACVEVGSVDNFSDLKKVAKILGNKISFWNRNIHYCRGIGYHYNNSTVEEKATHQGSCHQFVFDLLDSLSSDISLVSEKPSIIGMHDLLKDDLLLGKNGCIGSYLDWCANNLVKDTITLDNSEWCRVEMRESMRKQFAPLLRNKITQLSSQMIIDEEDDSNEQQLISYNKTLNLILFGNAFVSNQKRRKSRALSIGMIKSPPSPSTPSSLDSPRKKKKSDSVSGGTVVICFPTHSSLDEFVRDMVEVSKEEEKAFNSTPEFYLLKSFDRALWLRNNFDKNKICRNMDHSKLPNHEFLIEDNRKRTIQGKDPLTSLDYLDELVYNDDDDSALELIKSLRNEPAKVRNSAQNSNGKASMPTMRCLCPFGDPRRELPFIENTSIPSD